MSQRVRCMNCNAVKMEHQYYQPLCDNCKKAVDDVAKQATEQKLDPYAAAALKEQTLESLRIPLGMEGKKRPDALFNQIDTSELERRSAGGR